MSQQTWPPPKKRHRARNIFLSIVGLIALIIVIVVVRSGNGGNSTASSGTTGTPTPTTTHVAAPARLGSYLDVQDPAGNAYAVALTKVIDPAHSDVQVAPANGTRFVGAVFAIKGLTGEGPQQQNGDSAVTLVGSNGQTYAPEIIAIGGYTDFAVGEIHAPPGQSTVGAVTFQLPIGVKASSVHWLTFSNAGVGSTVQWNVPAPPPTR